MQTIGMLTMVAACAIFAVGFQRRAAVYFATALLVIGMVLYGE